MREANVAPRVGAWIETYQKPPCHHMSKVAPRVGAWIETNGNTHISNSVYVAPRVGAWIETTNAFFSGDLRVGRTPRGCVD